MSEVHLCSFADDIKRYGLLVRPDLLYEQNGLWRAGVFTGITGDGKAFCKAGTEVEGRTPEEAVALCVEQLVHRG
jgi:hypothetical protein